MSRVLLVSPTFHGYWRSIAAALSRGGHRVDTWLYDNNETWTAKLRHQWDHELRSRLGSSDRTDALMERLTRGTIRAVTEHRPDVVVTIKGDQLGEDYWDAIDRSRAARVTWLYDELHRMSYTEERLRRAGPLATYSPLDADRLRAGGHEVQHLPLAFDPHLCPTAPGERRDEIVFVGARYPQREADLRALHAAGAPVRAYGRDWSRHPVDRARTWDLSRPPVPAGRDVDRCAAYDAQARAAAVLNIHGDQDGFTMRTFEACGVGGVQLCDRQDVARHYEVGREVLVFSGTEELIELAGRCRRDRAWTDHIREAGRRRTLDEHTFDHRVRVLEKLWA